MLIVALFVAIGVAITLNTMKMNDLQANVNQQVEISNYASAYSKGFTLTSQSVAELVNKPNTGHYRHANRPNTNNRHLSIPT